MAFGFLKKAVKGIGKGIKKVGKFARKVSPALAFIPGVGTLAAAGIGAAGGLIGGEGLGGAAKGALGGAAGGLAKAGLGRIPGVGNFAGKVGKGLFGIGEAGGGLVGKVGQLALDRPELALGGIQAFQNAHAQNRFEGQQNEAREFSQQRMQQQQALQQAIIDRLSKMGQGQNFDQSAVFNDPGNPFNQARA